MEPASHSLCTWYSRGSLSTRTPRGLEAALAVAMGSQELVWETKGCLTTPNPEVLRFHRYSMLDARKIGTKKKTLHV